MTTADPASPRTPANRLALVLGALAAFAPFSTDAVVPASLAIAASLGADPGQVAGSLAAFFAGVGLGQLLHGPLSDRLGRRTPLFAGLTVFTLASLGCVLAPDTATLGWCRFAQGLGGCAGSVASRAVIRDVAEGAAGIRLLARLILVAGLAPIVAPSFGSLLLAAAGWRAIFAALALYGLFLLLLVARRLPETLPPDRRRRDGIAAILAVYGRLLTDRRFLAPSLAGMLPLAGMFAYIAGSPFVLMAGHGLSATTYAVIFGANAAGFVLAAQAAGWAAPRVGAERLLTAAQLGLCAIGAALVVVTLTDAGLAPLLALFALYLAACGTLTPLSVALAMAPQGRVAGSASAVLGAMQFGVGAGVVALLGALGGTPVVLAALMAITTLAGLAARVSLRAGAT